MNLVMLTKFYPYGTGEAFIENEMDVLSKYYDRILIIACEAPKDSTIRPVPQNIVVKKINATNSVGKIWDIVKGQSNYLRPCEAFHEESKKCRTLKQKVFLGYFEEKSRRIYKAIKQQNILSVFNREPLVLYSYWLFVTARVATFIQHDYNTVYSFSRAHGYDIYKERNGLNYLPYRELFLKSFNRVFPCSLNGERYLQSEYPEYKGKVKVSLLGTMDHGTGSQSADGVFRIVSCSRISPEKRVERIPEALALLEGKGMTIEWIHIGGGSKLKDIMTQATTTLGDIKFSFLGDMPNKQVMQLYRIKPFDLFINISSSEGLPVSIMEAISFGMPVIATDVGGTSEIVKDGVTGFLLHESFSNDELSDAIVYFYHLKYDTPEKYLNCRTGCRLFWESNFLSANNYSELFKYIQSDICY